VINLQTNFGGGKTHSMLALWHLAGGMAQHEFPQDVQDLLNQNGYSKIKTSIQRVALVGNHLAPSGDIKLDGTRVNTLWGELAWQLSGAEAYELVSEADRTRTAPGQALHDLLALYTPAALEALVHLQNVVRRVADQWRPASSDEATQPGRPGDRETAAG